MHKGSGILKKREVLGFKILGWTLYLEECPCIPHKLKRSFYIVGSLKSLIGVKMHWGQGLVSVDKVERERSKLGLWTTRNLKSSSEKKKFEHIIIGSTAENFPSRNSLMHIIIYFLQLHNAHHKLRPAGELPFLTFPQYS